MFSGSFPVLVDFFVDVSAEVQRYGVIRRSGIFVLLVQESSDRGDDVTAKGARFYDSQGSMVTHDGVPDHLGVCEGVKTPTVGIEPALVAVYSRDGGRWRCFLGCRY